MPLAGTMAPVIEPGDEAPDFELPDQDGRAVKLVATSAASRVVLYFYPKADTPGCTTQACGVRDHRADYAEVGLDRARRLTGPGRQGEEVPRQVRPELPAAGRRGPRGRRRLRRVGREVDVRQNVLRQRAHDLHRSAPTGTWRRCCARSSRPSTTTLVLDALRESSPPVLLRLSLAAAGQGARRYSQPTQGFKFVSIPPYRGRCRGCPGRGGSTWRVAGGWEPSLTASLSGAEHALPGRTKGSTGCHSASRLARGRVAVCAALLGSRSAVARRQLGAGRHPSDAQPVLDQGRGRRLGRRPSRAPSTSS